MANVVLDHKIDRRSGMTLSDIYTFVPWVFGSSFPVATNTRFVIDFDIIAIATNETTGTTYNNWYMKRWIWDYFPATFAGKLVNTITISVSSNDFSWSESNTTSDAPRVLGALSSSLKTFTTVGSARIVLASEL